MIVFKYGTEPSLNVGDGADCGPTKMAFYRLSNEFHYALNVAAKAEVGR